MHHIHAVAVLNNLQKIMKEGGHNRNYHWMVATININYHCRNVFWGSCGQVSKIKRRNVSTSYMQ